MFIVTMKTIKLHIKVLESWQFIAINVGDIPEESIDY